MLLPVLLACAGTGVPTDTSADTGACACSTTDACCDGCAPEPGPSACDDGTAATWAACATGACATGGVLSTYPLGEGVWAHAVAVAPSGVVVVAAEDALGGTGGRAGVFGPDGAAVLTRDGPYTGADLSPDGVVAALCGGALELVDAATGAFIPTDAACAGGAVSWSPDGASIAAAIPEGARVSDATGAARFDVAHARNPDARLWAIVWSPDGSRFATATGQAGFGSPKGEVKLWSAVDGAPLGELECTAMDLAWSADGARLAAACWNDVRVWDTSTYERLHTLPSGLPVLSVEWVGERLAIGALESGVRVIDLDTGADVLALGDEAGFGSPKDLDFGAFGLAAALWDAPGGALWSDLPL